jgi:hypothetical protein
MLAFIKLVSWITMPAQQSANKGCNDLRNDGWQLLRSAKPALEKKCRCDASPLALYETAATACCRPEQSNQRWHIDASDARS